MTYATNTTFEAPPEIVFDALTDPIGMARWLPDDVSRNPVGTGRMQVAQAAGEPAAIGPAEVGMTYLPAPERAWVAAVVIAPLPAGGTSLEVTVEPAGEKASSLVEAALTGLHREIGERFTTG
ncbi:uncharacterized protein YndB with AHSA1/START domain [Allocatelliglobosispora scoriae]|uniref:Uncharacterized protein YndB with AHSA1/START domain n=1 Tax=Allocatelliglobosispora scoriae TaxID=643052 RepID=A0A841BLF6_9ACTN|nr:SRPBCC family protein [Allocatelliglobosispora scoriae]MBB5867650.1 uncharacterized protein YndB with AHSA1/START domain [Allocatelliglobosispora scoriae]